jgi:hypothetical protein
MDDDRVFASGCLLAVGMAAVLWALIGLVVMAATR